VLFLILTFLSYVTAADSNTSAMSSVCTKGLTAEQAESPLMLKVIWGSIVGILACVMISFSGMEGIKIISVLGGFPALFLMIAVGFSAIRLILTVK
jgi:choline-glycine betaine transporter